MYYANVVRHETLKLWISFANKLYWTWHSILVLLGPRPDVMSVHFCKKKLWTLQLMPFRNFYNRLVKIIETFIFKIYSLFMRISVLVHPKMEHIHSKVAHSSKNGTFIQKWHIPPKMAHSSKSGTGWIIEKGSNVNQIFLRVFSFCSKTIIQKNVVH